MAAKNVPQKPRGPEQELHAVRHRLKLVADKLAGIVADSQLSDGKLHHHALTAYELSLGLIRQELGESEARLPWRPLP